jgi:pimeloyl-ACP methyl ester carboxylesterase
MAHELASRGYFVVIPRMPLNLAVFGANKAGQVIQAYPQVENWVIGGHSLGGSMAAHYLYQNPDLFSGLVFLASYPASSDDLSNFPGKVLSISGSLDGLSTPADIESSRALLPNSALFIGIEGGNHAQFGWYGAQSGDNPATISREEQQAIVVENIANLLDSFPTKE